MTSRISAVLLLLAGSIFSREQPYVPPIEKTRLFASAGAGFGGATAGIRIRAANSRSETGLHYAWFPGIMTVDGRINIFADNPRPDLSATFFGGPGAQYMEVRDKYGIWKTTGLLAVVGREHQIGPRIRFAYEGGGGILIASSREAIFPIDGMLRTELLFQVL